MAHNLYPPIEPYASGMLAVSDGNQIHWEASGTEAGTPALAVHGGPGSGSVPGMRRPFNPDKYRVVLFDQRGCGRSTPHASDPAVDLSTNTTDHLIALAAAVTDQPDPREMDLLLATGERKASCVEQLVTGPITTELPASFLQLHRDVDIMLDEAAAQKLRTTNYEL